MRNNIFYFLPAILLIGIFACQKDYVIPANADFSDPVVNRSGAKQIQRGDFTSFVDLSRGVLNRTWTIPASATIINAEGRAPSELSLVHVQFDDPGEYEVGLSIEFDDPTLNLDTLFPVEVLDYIRTELAVVDIAAGFFEQTPTQITMYEGGTITFGDASAGKPNRREWTFEGADPRKAGGISVEEDLLVDTLAVQYPAVGVYDVQLISWRQYPEGDPDTVLLKDYVNVIENVEPPTIVGITEDEQGVIHLSYNLPMKTGGDLTSHFTLSVDGVPTEITAVSLNPQDDRILDITPALNIDKLAEAKLSYDGNGPLSRLNDIAAPAFSGEDIEVFIPVNLLVQAGMDPTFESDNLDGWNSVLEPANSAPETNNAGAGFELTEDAYEGNRAMVVHINAGENMETDQKNNFRINTDIANFPIRFEAGLTYKVGFRYKIVGDGANQFTWRMHGEGWPPAMGGGWSPGAAIDWTYREITFNAPNPEALEKGKMSIQFIGNANNARADIYFDNISVFTE